MDLQAQQLAARIQQKLNFYAPNVDPHPKYIPSSLESRPIQIQQRIALKLHESLAEEIENNNTLGERYNKEWKDRLSGEKEHTKSRGHIGIGTKSKSGNQHSTAMSRIR